GLLSTGRVRAEQGKQESFTLIVLPDTQCYADVRFGFAAKRWKTDLRHCFFKQMQWIKKNKDELNIVMVAHVGDIVQADHPEEWKIADKAFGMLDGVVPYTVCLGNHDFGFHEDPDKPARFWFAANRDASNYNKNFGHSRLKSNHSRAGRLGETNENHYCQFEASGMKFLIISLEMHPRDESLVWASKIAETHRDHRCIVLTHSYMDTRNRRLSKDPYCDVKGNYGQAMWDKFISRHENIFMVLCGHMLGEGLLTSEGQNGNPVHQVMANYQHEDKGGGGYLRIMTFIPTEGRIDVQTYSPVSDQHKVTSRSRFSVAYEMKD
ncbi:MAG: metallophosphoesterase, partial [Planctomycetota bacterium]